MNYRFLVIYQKSSGELMYRTRTSRPNYKVGDRTSMGWKVIDIKNMYKGNILKSYDYREKIARKSLLNKLNIFMNNIHTKEFFNTITNYLMIYIFLKIIVNFNI